MDCKSLNKNDQDLPYAVPHSIWSSFSNISPEVLSRGIQDYSKQLENYSSSSYPRILAEDFLIPQVNTDVIITSSRIVDLLTPMFIEIDDLNDQMIKDGTWEENALRVRLPKGKLTELVKKSIAPLYEGDTEYPLQSFHTRFARLFSRNPTISYELIYNNIRFPWDYDYIALNAPIDERFVDILFQDHRFAILLGRNKYATEEKLRSLIKNTQIGIRILLNSSNVTSSTRLKLINEYLHS